MKAIIRSLTSIGFRGSVMASKFIVLAFLAKHLDPVSFGAFGVIQGIIVIAVVALGAEIYVAGNRDTIASGYAPSLIKSQFACYPVHYLAASIYLIWMAATGALPPEVMLPFVFIFYFEHLVVEVFRLMVAWKRPLSANAMLFIQTASWVGVALGAAYGFGIDFTLPQILWMWVAGEVTAVAFGLFILRRLVLTRAFLTAPFDRAHALGLYRKAVPFLIAALSIALANNLPRLLLADQAGLAVTGVFSYHFGIAMALYTLSFTGVALIRYPTLIAILAAEGYQGLLPVWRRFAREVAVATLGLAALVVIANHVLMLYVDRPELADGLPAFYVMMIGMIMLSLSLAPHYFLFTLRRDRAISLAGPAALAGMLAVSSLAFAGRYDIMTAAASIAVSGTTLLFVRSILAWRTALQMRKAATP